MAHERYLTYEEYKELGGKVSEDAFAILERQARHELDYCTFNRVPSLTTIPSIVKEVMAEMIDDINDFNNQGTSGELISEYSNGVETIRYTRTTESELTRRLHSVAYRWLPDYLVNRSLKFNVGEYLQSDSNSLE